jgi:hypothetical protein
MHRIGLAAMTVLLGAGVAAPASAAWNTIGSVDFDARGSHERTYTQFGGPVERLNFSASGEDVRCRAVRATFGNGRTRQIFAGTIREGTTVAVDLPGDDRNVRRLDFLCESLGRRDARVAIGVDVGTFFQQWMRDPRWAPIFGGPGRADSGWGRDDRHDRGRHGDRWEREGWTMLGRERFEGRGDREAIVTGWRGREIQRLGFRAEDGDARCMRVRVTFGNGRTRDLDPGTLRYMRQGEMNRIDLPGDARNITRVQLMCRAVRDRAVSIQVFADQEDRYGGGRDEQGWITLGRERFEGGRDREAIAAGWRGESVDRLAFRALDNDARCARVRVTFGNGRTRDLDADNLRYMRRGELNRVDLPGNERNIQRVQLTCRAVRDRDVTIQIYGRK